MPAGVSCMLYNSNITGRPPATSRKRQSISLFCGWEQICSAVTAGASAMWPIQRPVIQEKSAALIVSSFSGAAGGAEPKDSVAVDCEERRYFASCWHVHLLPRAKKL